jgi:surface polysaccharide O-acyltransferase-like enzyme
MLLANIEISEFCSKTAAILQFVGYIVTVIKIAIPLLIIILGIIDFGKAVVAAKDDKMKDSAKSLGRRLIAGVVIFFIPSIVMWLFESLTEYNSENKDAFNNCRTCILHPFDCKVSDK